MTKINSFLFYLSFGLILLPPLFIGAGYINSHTLAKIIIAFLFIFYLLRTRETHLKKRLFKYKKILLFFLVLFIFQSLSIVKAINIVVFLKNYEDLLFTISWFFLLCIRDEEPDRLVKLLFICFQINLIIQLAIYFYPQIIIDFGKGLIQPDYFNLVEINIQRSRVFLESYDQIIIPIAMYFAFYKEKLTVALITIPIIIFLTFLSNFRTNFLMLIFSIFFSIYIFRNNIKRSVCFYSILTIALIVFLYMSQQSKGQLIDRLLLKDERTDISTITNRLDKWNEAVEIGKSSPLIGVGLGNYYDYLKNRDKKSESIDKFIKFEQELSAKDPHNIFFRFFGETGLFGLTSFIILVLYFLLKDRKILRSGNKITKVFLLSFWTLFIYSIFNPSSTIKYQTLFWSLRFYIEKNPNDL